MPTNASRQILLTPNTIISGNFGSYLIKEFKGEGTYGRVARCVDLSTREDVAVKMSRLGQCRTARHEANLLRQLRGHSHSKNIVKFINSFHYQDHYCLVLEHLDRSLFDYIRKAQKPTHVGDIRYIAEQVLVALRELEERGLIHADLKPDNVMLVNQQLEPFRVKLIDFGMTMTGRCLLPGVTVQASSYRAPEMSLGTKMNGAIDMWALGCVLAYVYLGENLFPYRCDYQIMRALTQMCGMPDLQQLNEGLFTQSFFTKQHGEYRLKTVEEYNARATRPTTHCSSGLFRRFTCLEDMMEHRPAPQTDEEKQETRQFFYLLRQLLQVNPAKRISAVRALRHPFITQRYESKMSLIKYLRLVAGVSPQEEGDRSPEDSLDSSGPSGTNPDSSTALSRAAKPTLTSTSTEQKVRKTHRARRWFKNVIEPGCESVQTTSTSTATHQNVHDRVVEKSRVAENGINKNTRMYRSKSADDSGMVETSTKERSVMGRICRFFRQTCTSCINACVED